MARQATLFDLAPDPWELDAAAQRLVASVVFPEPPHGPLDYEVPPALAGRLAAGQRVEVPLGKQNALRVGCCVAVGAQATQGRPLKKVRRVLDAQPLLSPTMLELAAWVADYYLCPLGQVLWAMVPAGVRQQAGTRQVTLLSVPAAVQQALQAGTLDLPPKQQEVLRQLALAPRPLMPLELAKAAHCTLAPIMALRKKQLIVAQVRRMRLAEHAPVRASPEPAPILHPEQEAALDAILAALRSGRHATLLLHGVTGSGKTEVYIRAIQEVLSYGRQAIVLVPEISLTPQTRSRFESRFAQVAVLHSHLSDAERHWHWERIARGEVSVVVGARSAVFAPTPRLGLIVIDEEHDSSFKQGESPRYHAREVARRRAELEGIPLVLGSATPSLESWMAARRGSVQLVELPRRVSGRPLPAVEVVDLRLEARRRASLGAISRPLHQAIDEALREGGQVILLLNRRGYSTHIQCPACGHVVQCPHCDLALTHHRDVQQALCHHCGHQAPPPSRCPSCGCEQIRFSGVGTQRLQAEVQARFPQARILRMDSDSMQRPGSHEAALTRFRNGEIQILLGTQMIAKGLDFPNVTLVGVVHADTTLHFCDLRAAERTFQLVTQVAGRTGRGDRPGRVLVQTFSPEHYAIQAAARHDFEAFVAAELPGRQQHGYPPFASLVRLIFRGTRQSATERLAHHAAQTLADALTRSQAPHRVLGPAPCPLAKLRDRFRYHLLLCSPDGDALRSAVRTTTPHWPVPEEVEWVADVDPIDLL
jgi:primosomal protein N' (replication factor Y)